MPNPFLTVPSDPDSHLGNWNEKLSSDTEISEALTYHKTHFLCYLVQGTDPNRITEIKIFINIKFYNNVKAILIELNQGDEKKIQIYNTNSNIHYLTRPRKLIFLY